MLWVCYHFGGKGGAGTHTHTHTVELVKYSSDMVISYSWVMNRQRTGAKEDVKGV